jgi:hypothetical protein
MTKICQTLNLSTLNRNYMIKQEKIGVKTQGSICKTIHSYNVPRVIGWPGQEACLHESNP